MPHLLQFPDSPESPLPMPIAEQPGDDDVADIPTQKQSVRTQSLYNKIDDIIRLDTIKIAARRSQETIARIPTVHIPTISQYIARIPTTRIPTVSQYFPAVVQRRLAKLRRNDRLIIIILLIGLLILSGLILLECLDR
jgi:hypothetical protein